MFNVDLLFLILDKEKGYRDMISMICVYNDKNKLKNMVKSCNKMKENIEWILINNINGRFHSAAAALNYGFRKATSDILIFLHQDIVFHECMELKSLEDRLIQDNKCIIGVAGVKYIENEQEQQVLSTIHDGIDGNHVYNCHINQIEEVFTVDECLLATTRNVMKRLIFDEKLGWHFYGADLCLQGADRGYKTYIIPIKLTHYSHGTINRSYFKSLGCFVNKWKKVYRYLCTTTIWVSTKKYNSVVHYIWWKYPWTLEMTKKLLVGLKSTGV